MGLNTENSNAVVGAAAPNSGEHKVVMLIGTRVKSLEADVPKGAVVVINDADYRFLKPYGYCKDFEEDAPEAEAEVEAEAPTADETPATEDNAPKGKRAHKAKDSE